MRAGWRVEPCFDRLRVRDPRDFSQRREIVLRIRGNSMNSARIFGRLLNTYIGQLFVQRDQPSKVLDVCQRGRAESTVFKRNLRVTQVQIDQPFSVLKRQEFLASARLRYSLS